MIRDGQPADVAAIVAIEADVFGADAWHTESVAAELVAPGRRVRVSGDPVSAYAVTMVVGDVADLLRIAVRPEQRRRGLAGALLEDAVVAAAAAGADRMLLEVATDNTAALRLYAGAGFTEVDRRARYYAGGVDAVVLRRSLRSGCGARGSDS
ncbi:GNAT family N-acetyltransferase [Nocardioides limicola]|uniref:GNAT family N-acetyltransferase n=1 Tax=Nocardioides limicola TaxID=2803368 RepID=UPI00193C30B5|nr:GNAT family N-acetyltransferase [Nocardioides sp. DJM-14]